MGILKWLFGKSKSKKEISEPKSRVIVNLKEEEKKNDLLSKRDKLINIHGKAFSIAIKDNEPEDYYKNLNEMAEDRNLSKSSLYNAFHKGRLYKNMYEIKVHE